MADLKKLFKSDFYKLNYI